MSMDSKMPKPFSGHWPKGGQGLGSGYVNPQPVRLVGAGERKLFNEEQIQRRSVAHDPDGSRPGKNKNELGGR